MNGKNGSNLIMIENGQLKYISLDDKQEWEVGRPTPGNIPDIPLYSTTVSRRHGKFQNVDGIWFYLDLKGKNGTVYNEKHLTVGKNGRVKPVMIKDGDIFIFGGGEEAVINSKTIWAFYTTRSIDQRWRVEDTKGMTELVFCDDSQVTKVENPVKGMVIQRDFGIAIYMGDITYLSGNMRLKGN